MSNFTNPYGSQSWKPPRSNFLRKQTLLPSPFDNNTMDGRSFGQQGTQYPSFRWRQPPPNLRNLAANYGMNFPRSNVRNEVDFEMSRHENMQMNIPEDDLGPLSTVTDFVDSPNKSNLEGKKAEAQESENASNKSASISLSSEPPILPPVLSVPSDNDELKQSLETSASKVDNEGESSDNKIQTASSYDGLKQTQQCPPYHCELCSVTCMSEQNFNSHLEGSRHHKNLKVQDLLNPPARIMTQLQDMKDPLLGLNYICEFSNAKNAADEKYLCKLCSVKGDTRVITSHMTGLKHRLEYIKKYYPDEYVRLSNVKGKVNAEVMKLSTVIEQKEGRGVIRIGANLSPFGSTLMKRPNQDNSNTTDPKRIRVESPELKKLSNIANINTSLSNDENRTEDESHPMQSKEKCVSSDIEKSTKRNLETNILRDNSTENKSFLTKEENFLHADLNAASRSKADMSSWKSFSDEQKEDAQTQLAKKQFSFNSGNVGSIVFQDNGDKFSSKKSLFGNKSDETSNFQFKLDEDVATKIAAKCPELANENKSQFEKFLVDDPLNMSLSKGNIGILLQVLSKCVIKNEEDAEMALQVSDALTQALLKYRLQNLPKEVIANTLLSAKIAVSSAELGDSNASNVSAVSAVSSSAKPTTQTQLSQPERVTNSTPAPSLNLNPVQSYLLSPPGYGRMY